MTLLLEISTPWLCDSHRPTYCLAHSLWKDDHIRHFAQVSHARERQRPGCEMVFGHVVDSEYDLLLAALAAAITDRSV
jgi:hypothetical protein